MKAEAFELTSGLRYVPQPYANTEEVIELAKVAASTAAYPRPTRETRETAMIQ